MRAFMIAVGLVATVLVAGLIGFSAQLTSQRVVETLTTQLSNLGFEAAAHGESSLGIFPDAFIDEKSSKLFFLTLPCAVANIIW